MRLILGGAAGFCGGGTLPDGRVISRLLIICGVVMMKMTRSTNTRSSSGVMFNSFNVLWPRWLVFFMAYGTVASAATTSKRTTTREGKLGGGALFTLWV